MMSLIENLHSIQRSIPDHVKIVAVSKTKPVEDILELYHAGFKTFGENRAQELVRKKEQLPEDIQWHMIGHLQRNKVKYIVPFVTLIHSIDSARLLKEVNKEAKKTERVIDCLLQMHIAKEESKFGFSFEELTEFMASEEFASYQNVRIRGLMAMATFTDDTGIVRSEFQYLATCFRTIRDTYFNDSDSFTELSMGMSDDYRIAIEEGSTMVRIGSLIFGSRN
jgi:PLP dependent protein